MKSYSIHIHQRTTLYYILFLLLLGSRLFYLGGIIDDPHAWRQADTANYIDEFYKNGIQLLRPSVCWMGNYKTLILEFPLPEALVALLYNMLGPSLLIARLFTVVCFIVSCYYLFQIIQFYFDYYIAQISTLVFSALPLSLYFSRAIQIDFFVLACSLGYVYHFLTGMKTGNWKSFVIGSIFCTVALLVKSPYVFAISFLLVPSLFKGNLVASIVQLIPYCIIPAILCIAWIIYSNHINSQAPDWYFLPGYRKFDSNNQWYFGTLAQRMAITNWLTIGKRIYEEAIGGILGLVMLFIGLWNEIKLKRYAWWISLFTGLSIYVLVFYNLNLVHNYYQIPFLIGTSILISLGIKYISTAKPKVITWILLILLSAANLNFAYKNYYDIPPDQLEIAEIVKSYTSPDETMLISYSHYSVHCPLILYRAHRRGWSLPAPLFKPEIIKKLHDQEGCRYLIFVPQNVPSFNDLNYLDSFEGSDIILKNGLTLYLRDLQSPKKISNQKN